jgi:hypothetical protein
MKWKPIETAPKDGTYVLISRAGLTTTSNAPILPPAVARWKETTEGTYKKKISGQWLGVDTGSPILGRPVRWAPLPIEPEE